ncbi:MAG: hypothetical protein AB9903_18085 [Vulcanimicrobiota bacterium]
MKMEPGYSPGFFFVCAGDILLEKDINITPLVMSSERFVRLREIERGIALEIERDGIEI